MNLQQLSNEKINRNKNTDIIQGKKATLGLIFGVIAILTSFTPILGLLSFNTLSAIGFLFSFSGLINSISGLNSSKKTRAIVGIILNIFSFIFSFIIIFLFLSYFL